MALRLTLPQVIMLNHAAWVNHERFKTDDEPSRHGDNRSKKKPQDMTTEELQMEFGDIGGYRVIS